MDQLKDALKNRKNKGVALTIIVGSGDDKSDIQHEQDLKEQGLAPDVKDAGMPQDQSMNQGPMAKQETPMGHSDEQADKDLIEKMLASHEAGENDQQGPMTIGKRARMAARTNMAAKSKGKY